MGRVPIGECTDACATWNPRSEPNTQFPYIDIASVSRETKTIENVSAIIGADAPSRARQIVMADDVLVSTVRPNLNAVAQVPTDLDGATASTGFTVLRPNEKLDSRYLLHWVMSPAFVADMVRKATGASYPAVSDRIVKDSLIPLPPLPEQRRIAAILDKADALRAKRRQAIAKLDALLQSVFLEMFGDPVTNPKGWPVTSVDSITDTRLGKMLDKRTRQGDHMRPYLANRNVQWGRFVLTDLGTMNFDPADQEEFALQPGDLLMCEGGEPGRCAIWRGQLEDCYFQKALHRVRCHTEKCLPEYLLWLFWFLAQAGAFRSSIAVATIAHLPGVKLKKLRVPVPTLDRQQQFARMCAQIDNTKERLLAGGSLQNSLMASLQHESFAGSV